MDADKKILPHGSLQKIADNLWVVEGELPHGPLPRTMTVYRMKDGGLWIHSAIALNDSVLKDLTSLGQLKYLVVPNTMHRLDAPFYKELFPNIQVVCPRAARKKVEEKIKVDEVCEVAFENSEIKVDTMPGVKPEELAYELSLGNDLKAMIINDVIVNVPTLEGVGGLMMKCLGRIGFFRTPPVTKLILLNSRKDFKKWLVKQSQRRDLSVVTVSHGQSVRSGIPALFQRAAEQM